MSTAARSVAESRMVQEGQQNAGGARFTDENNKPYYHAAPLSDYPRMMYRRTDIEQTQPHAEQIEQLRDAPMVINNFGTAARPMLCDTVVVDSATDAETLAEDGWEISPAAAYGLVSGIVAATTAKDDEIAALRAELARRDEQVAATGEQAEKRGPGRPRLTPAV